MFYLSSVSDILTTQQSFNDAPPPPQEMLEPSGSVSTPQAQQQASPLGVAPSVQPPMAAGEQTLLDC